MKKRNWKNLKTHGKTGKIGVTLYLDKMLMLAYEKIEGEGKYKLSSLMEDKVREIIVKHKILKEAGAVSTKRKEVKA